MACCRVKLVMVLLPLWPAVPALAQSGNAPYPVPSAAASSDLMITEAGSVVRSPTATGTSKVVGRIPQSPASPPHADPSHADVQMAFAPSAQVTDDQALSQIQPCTATPALSSSDAKALVKRVAEQERFYPDFVLAVARQESRFKVDALSEKGAYGLMQLMPATAKQFDVDHCIPEANVRGGIRFLRELHERYRNPLYMLAAYNAGETALRDHGGIPPFPETVGYVAAVLNDFLGYPGVNLAAAAASPVKATRSRVAASSAAAARRTARSTQPTVSAVTPKPGDWLVLHVE